jgi:hypothetical protein
LFIPPLLNYQYPLIEKDVDPLCMVVEGMKKYDLFLV